MSSFTENVHIQPMPKSNKWVTTKSFRYYVGKENSNEYIDVPAGFEFDGASVPMFFGMLIQRVEPKTISAACLHDYLYTEGRIYNRKKTDKIFRESLIVSGCSKTKSYIMWMGVRLGGRLYWNKFV